MISGYPLTTYLDARLSWQVVYLQNQSYCDFHTLQAYSILSQKKCTSHIGYIYIYTLIAHCIPTYSFC